MDIGLNDCPFCGSLAVLTEKDGKWFVSCINFTASVGYIPQKPEISGLESKYIAITAWNYRK